MLENEKYILSYLNNKSNTLSFYVERMLISNLKEKEYAFYKDRIKRLIDDIKKIIETLKVENIPINNFFNNLYLIKDVDFIDELLKKYNYEVLLKNSYDNIIKGIISNDYIDLKEKDLIEFLILNDFIMEEDKINVYEFFIKNTLKKRNLISYDAFKKVIIEYSRCLAKLYCDNPIIEINNNNKFKLIFNKKYNNKIFIEESELQLMYITGSFKVLKHIFHDLRFIEQNSNVLGGKNDPLTFSIIKDEILSESIPYYYKNNYKNLVFNLDASRYSMNSILYLCNKFNIVFKDGNPYKKRLNTLEKKIKNSERIVNDDLIDLNLIIDEILNSKPEFFEKYPQLAEEYKNLFGDVIERNR